MLFSLINDLLDTARLRSGQLTIECKPFRLLEPFEQATAICLPRAAEKGLAIKASFDPELHDVLVKSDPTRLWQVRPLNRRWVWGGVVPTHIPGREGVGESEPDQWAAEPTSQVLLNIAHNAVRFTSQGDIRISAKQLSRTHERVELELLVSDDGVGIAPDLHKTIFECGQNTALLQPASSSRPSFQLNSSAAGAGLGLYICEQLVTLLGGSISVTSTVGVGSTFTVRLSLQLHHESASPQPDETPKKPPQLCHFLLIEDNPLNIKVCSTLLVKMGHSVTVAEDGQQAVDAVAKGLTEHGKHAFDMALMDCEMPIMDGFEATRQIRKMERERNVQAALPIVALSVRALSPPARSRSPPPARTPSMSAATCAKPCCVPGLPPS